MIERSRIAEFSALRVTRKIYHVDIGRALVMIAIRARVAGTRFEPCRTPSFDGRRSRRPSKSDMVRNRFDRRSKVGCSMFVRFVMTSILY